MSLTKDAQAVAATNESAVNSILQALGVARGQLFAYRSSEAIGGVDGWPQPSGWSPLPPISFPGLQGDIHYAVRIRPPAIDFDPASAPVPDGAQFPPGGIAARTALGLAVLAPNPGASPLSLTVDVWGAGLTVREGDLLSFRLVALDVQGLGALAVEAIVEALALAVLNGILGQVRLPLSSLRGDAFPLVLTGGPTVAADQVSFSGDVV
jgi:hypothetical protein